MSKVTQRQQTQAKIAASAQAQASQLNSLLHGTDPTDAARRSYEANARAERIAKLREQVDHAVTNVRGVQTALTDAREQDRLLSDDEESRQVMRRLVQTAF